MTDTEALQAAIQAAQDAVTAQGDAVRLLKAEIKQGISDKVQKYTFILYHVIILVLKVSISCRIKAWSWRSGLGEPPGSHRRPAGPLRLLPACIVHFTPEEYIHRILRLA
jgi:hypothetical protein